MKNLKRAILCNTVLFLLEVFATLWMMSGIRISKGASAFTSARFQMLKYFTVDSNILMGIVALIFLIYQLQVLKGMRKEIPFFWYTLKLAATTSVTLTMMVSVFFLAPTSGSGWMALFRNSNFFLHLFNPLFAIFVFICFEKKKARFLPITLIGIVPMLFYAIYYVAVVFSHLENGVISSATDWYGFFAFGLKSIYIILPLIFLITYLISITLWFFNQRHASP